MEKPSSFIKFAAREINCKIVDYGDPVTFCRSICSPPNRGRKKKNEPIVEAVAFRGVGVFETPKDARQVLTELKAGG